MVENKVFVLGETRVVVKEGDITEEEVDGIVNAANNHFWMGAGVAGAIKRKGGREIEREAVSKGPVPVGEAVVTGAGKLRAKYVVHAAVMGQDFKTTGSLVRKAAYSALKRAEEYKMGSLAFPALGCGVGRLPYRISVKEMLKALKEFVAKSGKIEEIRFVMYGEEALREAIEAVEEFFEAKD